MSLDLIANCFPKNLPCKRNIMGSGERVYPSLLLLAMYLISLIKRIVSAIGEKFFVGSIPVYFSCGSCLQAAGFISKPHVMRAI